MASTAVRTCGTAVIRMTAMVSLRARMRGSTAGPCSPGMRTSSSATSIRRDRTISRAAAPSAASSTSKSSWRMMRRDSRTPASSSMTRTTGRDGYVNGGGAPGSPGGPPSALRLGYGEDDILVPASAALQIHGNGIARLGAGDDALEMLDIGDGLAVDLEDRVPRLDPRRVPGAARGHVGDQHTGFRRELEALRTFRREGLDLESEHLLLGRDRRHRLLARLLTDLDGER